MANELERWSPFRELDRFRRDFDELFERFLGGRGRAVLGQPATTTPAIESFIEGDKLVVRADLPGIDPNDVEVTVTGNMLVVRGKRETREETKGKNFIHREVSYGSFERAVELPEGVKAEDIKAAYKNGVLEVSVPLPKETAPRKVAIQIESGATKAKSA